MNPTEILEQITILASRNQISKNDLMQAFNRAEREENETNLVRTFFTRSKLSFYLTALIIFLGGVIVFLGLFTVLSNYWVMLTTNVKIGLSLGTGLVAFIAGVFAARDKRLALFGSGLFFISSIMFPVGLALLLSELFNVSIRKDEVASIWGFILFSLYFITYYFLPSDFLIVLITSCATLFFTVFTSFLNTYFNLRLNDSSYGLYKIFLIGFIYTIFSYLLFKKRKKILAILFLLLGNIVFLYAALNLAGTYYRPNHYWEFLFPLLVFCSLYVSIIIRHKSEVISVSLLIINLCYSSVFIHTLTEKYFKNSISWPITLIVCGMLLIIAGILYFKTRYTGMYKKLLD